MISRRHLRMKVLQAIYAYTMNPEANIAKSEIVLKESVESIYELFIYQLSSMVELVAFVERRLVEAKQKHLPTAEDLNPNRRFTENQFIKKVKENRDYIQRTSQMKIDWELHQDTLRKVFLELEKSELYRDYMAVESTGFNDDRSFMTDVYQQFILQSVAIRFIFEEINYHWTDDIDIAAFMLQKAARSIKLSSNEFTKLPPLFKATLNEEGKNDDFHYMITLFRKTILNNDKYSKLIAERVKNWDFDRVATLDLIILRMAFVEILECPTIPVKVTINEYIDLSKMFSTPRSSTFINGILDRYIKENTENGVIKKLGRGLINS